ncbi:MAG: PIG-L family deacetylase [Ignavibacteriae bacterium]|nr:PIG-L family deacetylase [Ignavibacteriota bacterium]
MDLSAHPDDEDGATLAYYAKLFGVKTYSIFYTRGEGGQNEIGSELYDDLGRIRTKETLEAATILGTEVYFLGFPDFGFSKTAGETFIRWGGKDIVLERLVYFIRALKPDVIITNHDTITTLPDRQHGNHQAVGVSAYEAFDKAADSTFHPEQFQDPTIRPWQVKKLFFRFFGKGNPAQVVQINITKKDASGKDIQEISLDALAKHRSQGMDKTSIERIPEWFRKHTYALIRADQHYPPDAYDLFSGIQPSMRVIARLRAETVDFPSLLSLNVSPNFSVLERQDEKDKFQLRRNFTVTLVNNSDEEVPVDLSVTSDSRKIFYKSYQIPHGAFADKVTLTVTKSIAAQRQLLRFDALPGQSTPIEMKPVSKTVTLKPVHAEFEKKIAIGLVKTYDNTTEEVLQSFNISYRLIDSAMLAKGDLHKFTTIILDLRTYQYRADAVLYNDKLLEYVRKGGNIVCFYHKVGDWNGKQFAPYPITLTNERVTQEDAPVSILLPNHPFLNSPNIIRPEDWIGWVQERSIYLPADDTTKTSSYYTRLLAMSDSEERQPPTSILWSQYGKGSYAYVSLALYRQLRILNEGAVKLFFNLISQSRQPSKRGRRARD